MRWAVLLDTPVGDVAVAVDHVGVCRVHFGRPPDGAVGRPGGGHSLDVPSDEGSADLLRADLLRADLLLSAAAAQLRDYFAGARRAFDLPLSIPTGTPFEQAVWAQLATIPYAEMRTYGQIAAAVGEPGAGRAVGVACARNHLAIVLPCHRVVGAGGKLVGFGGGLPRKRRLLEIEARVRIEQDFG